MVREVLIAEQADSSLMRWNLLARYAAGDHYRLYGAVPSGVYHARACGTWRLRIGPLSCRNTYGAAEDHARRAVRVAGASLARTLEAIDSVHARPLVALVIVSLSLSAMAGRWHGRRSEAPAASGPSPTSF